MCLVSSSIKLSTDSVSSLKFFLKFIISDLINVSSLIFFLLGILSLTINANEMYFPIFFSNLIIDKLAQYLQNPIQCNKSLNFFIRILFRPDNVKVFLSDTSSRTIELLLDAVSSLELSVLSELCDILEMLCLERLVKKFLSFFIKSGWWSILKL